MSAFFAFLHHIAAFALISALVVEFALLKETLTATLARRLLLADLVFGVSAAAVLVIGLLRVFFFEKGAIYYFTNLPFLGKLALFALIGALSARPTKTFLSWRAALKNGQDPSISAENLSRLQRTVLIEMGLAAVLILFAAMMARGIGSF